MGGKKKKSICRECSKAKFPAISAAKLGHEACLITAYRFLGVFNERDTYGATPIHYAARSGQLDCLKWLLANSGISPVAAAKNGTTAAHDAAAMGHLLCLEFLLEKTKCSAQDRTNEGATILHMACRFGHVEVTRWLIEKGLSSPSERGNNGVTPVHLCAAKNHLKCMKYLTGSSRYVPNQLTVHGATPVYFAAQEGSLECLQWLVKQGEGDPTIFANDGMGPLHAAAQAGELECLIWLVQRGGILPNQKAEDGATAMHFAAAGGQISCLRWLVENGGSLLDRDDLGGTPLHDAAEQGQTEVVSFILGCGIQKDITDNDGYTPIDLAKDNNHEECMKLFYIKNPNLLNSLAPQHPQNRGARISAEEEVLLRKEKQRQFEKALLSNTTAREQQHIWKEAKENVPVPKQPSADIMRSNGSGGGSKRSKNRNSLDAHRLSLSLINDLIDDHANKDRLPLSPDLFLDPEDEVKTKVKEDENSTNEQNKTIQTANVTRDYSSDHDSDTDTSSENNNKDDNKNSGRITARNDSFVTSHQSNDGGTVVADKPVVGNKKTIGSELSPYADSDDEELDKPVTNKKSATNQLSSHDKKSTAVGQHKQLIRQPITDYRVSTDEEKSTQHPSPKPVQQDIQQDKPDDDDKEQLQVKDDGEDEVKLDDEPATNSKKISKWKRLFGGFRSKKPSKQNPSVSASSAAGNGPTVTSTTVNKKTKRQTSENVASKKKNAEVVLRSKPAPKGEVFIHKTMEGDEEWAIVTHGKRQSTNDDEVSVKFEKKTSKRQSTISAIDRMSSPESSDDEMFNGDDDQDDNDDIFRPISKSTFDKFGQELLMAEIDTSGPLLEDRGSLASLETMIVHQEVEQSSDVKVVVESVDDNQPHLLSKPSVATSNNSNLLSPGYQVPATPTSLPPPVKSDQPTNKGSKENRRKVFDELMVKSSPAPVRRRSGTGLPLLASASSIEEEDEDLNEEEEERQDSVPPLPTAVLHTSTSKEKIVDIQLTTNNNFPPLNNHSGLRSFTKITQVYNGVEGGMRNSLSRLNSRGTSAVPAVYSPLMVTATASTPSPRTSLSSVQEERDELQSPPDENVGMKDSSLAMDKTQGSSTKVQDKENHSTEEEEDNRISLTPSQEAAFDTLERIKHSLQNDSPADKNIAEDKKTDIAEEKETDKVTNYKDALRTSPAVEELSDMIKGLDELMRTKQPQDHLPTASQQEHIPTAITNQQQLEEHTLTASTITSKNAAHNDASSEDFTPPTSEVPSLVSTPRQMTKNGTFEKPKEVFVSVEVDGHGMIKLKMKKNALAISLIFKVAEIAEISLTNKHALFEVNNSLKIERPLEDHERIDEVMSRWSKKVPSHFHLHTYHEKYQLWEDNPLPKGYIGEFLKHGKVPNISSPLHFCKGGGVTTSRMKWIREIHCLGSLGIYLIGSSKLSNNMDLVCATDQHLFFPVGEMTKYKSLPSKHCFIMKPVNSWREKDLKIFCCEDYQSYTQWVSGIRLVKYGLQLKCNYVAMGKRLHQNYSKTHQTKLQIT